MGQNIGLVRRAGEEKRIDSNNIHLRSTEVTDSVFGTEELVLVALESAASGLPMYLIIGSLLRKALFKVLFLIRDLAAISEK